MFSEKLSLTNHTDPGGYACCLDLGISLDTAHAIQTLLTELQVCDVRAIIIGHHVGDTGFCGCGHKLEVGVWWSLGGERDDEELLAFKGGDQRCLLVIVNPSDLDAVWEFAGAFFTSDGCDDVLARFQESLGELLADMTSSLDTVSK